MNHVVIFDNGDTRFLDAGLADCEAAEDLMNAISTDTPLDGGEATKVVFFYSFEKDDVVGDLFKSLVALDHEGIIQDAMSDIIREVFEAGKKYGRRLATKKLTLVK